MTHICNLSILDNLLINGMQYAISALICWEGVDTRPKPLRDIVGYFAESTRVGIFREAGPVRFAR